MAASEVTGHFLDGPIAKNILKGVLLQHVKFYAFIIKWTIPSNITTSQPNYCVWGILATFFIDMHKLNIVYYFDCWKN